MHQPVAGRLREPFPQHPRAADTPHMPWTPPPGGVEAEQRYTPSSGVRYGFQRGTGRNTVWRNVAAPPLTSPPSRFGLYDSASDAVRTVRASTRSRKPGAKRSICASMRSLMSTLEPLGTWQ